MSTLTPTLRRTAISLAIAGTIAAAPQGAHALAYALSNATVKNMVLTSSAGDLPGFGGSFSFSASNSASMDGFGSENGAGFEDTANLPFSQDGGTNVGLVIDPPQAFVGAIGRPGENTFSAVGPTPTNFARADHILTDTLINSCPAGSFCGATPQATPGGGGGDWRGIAESSLNIQNAQGEGNTGNNQTWRFGTFAITAPMTARFDFDIDLELIAFLDGQEQLPAANAFAKYGLTFNFQAAPGVTNNTATTHRAELGNELTSTLAGEFSTATADSLSVLGSTGVAFTTAPTAGGFVHVTLDLPITVSGTYQFIMSKEQEASVRSGTVPEPASLALVGGGLLAMGGLARRRRRSQAA